MHNRSFRDDVVLFILSDSPYSGHRNRNHGPSGQPSGRASHSATEIRGDLSHSLAFSSLKYYIAHPVMTQRCFF